MAIRSISVCAGAGGFDLAMSIAIGDIEPLVYIEREVPAAQILAARIAEGSLPAAHIWSDLSTFDATFLRGKVDVCFGGLPCQPFSVAGKQRGEDDERYIWPHFFRILRESECPVVILENVPPFVAGGYFRAIGAELCRMGYRVEEPIFVTAASVGAPHKRERVFVLAWRPGAVADSKHAERRSEHKEHGDSYGRCGSGRRGSALGYADQPGSQGRSLCGCGCSDERAVGATGATELADADEYRCEGSRLHVPERRPQQTIPDTYGPVALFPPGPGATDEWQRILADRPWLAPATQPGLRVMADDVALVLDEARTDQLRAGGNGVVALCGAAAITELVRRAGITL